VGKWDLIVDWSMADGQIVNGLDAELSVRGKVGFVC